MPRKTLPVTIASENRDKGKTYVITEMPASKAEKLAAKTLLALSRAGVDVPEDIAQAGVAAIAVLGFKALSGVSWEDAEPILDEMFSCVSFQWTTPNGTQATRPLIEEDIEEIGTRLHLRAEIFTLHTGFSIADAKPK